MNYTRIKLTENKFGFLFLIIEIVVKKNKKKRKLQFVNGISNLHF